MVYIVCRIQCMNMMSPAPCFSLMPLCVLPVRLHGPCSIQIGERVSSYVGPSEDDNWRGLAHAGDIMFITSGDLWLGWPDHVLASISSFFRSSSS